MPIEIESADDPRVADYLALRERGDSIGGETYFIAESELVVTRLVTSRYKPRSFLLLASKYDKLHALIDPLRVPVYVVTREVMQQIAGFDVHRGVLASVNRRRNPTLPDVLAGARRVLVLEGSNDLQNIGAIARSARGLGFDALVLDPTCADPFSRRAVRVSMGEILHLPVVRCERWPSPIEYLASVGFETWALTPAPEANSLFDMGMPDKVALVAGAEGPGLTEAARRATQFDVRIPMHRGVDSLNLGHALAIAMAAVSLPVSPPVSPPVS